MVLAKLTGWGLGDMLELELEELLAWVKSAQAVEKEIARSAKGGR